MHRKYLFPLLALLGAIFGLLTVRWTQKEMPKPPILFPPASSPYPNAIAGAGIIEASSLNISIGCPFIEIIEKIYVVEGDFVEKGATLFQLDLRNFEAIREAAKAELEVALVNLENQKKQFSFYERLKDPKAASEQAYQQTYFAKMTAQENVRVAEASLREAEVNIERACIRAPVTGEILQVNIHIGEVSSNISTGFQSIPLILMGTVNPLQVRIDIDEDDAWRYEPKAEAMAFVRGNRNIAFPLKYFRTEPYIIPKSSFTGATTERVDTRVLQVLYQFERNDLPVYAGQILDIFIKSKSIEELLK